MHQSVSFCTTYVLIFTSRYPNGNLRASSLRGGGATHAIPEAFIVRLKKARATNLLKSTSYQQNGRNYSENRAVVRNARTVNHK